MGILGGIICYWDVLGGHWECVLGWGISWGSNREILGPTGYIGGSGRATGRAVGVGARVKPGGTKAVGSVRKHWVDWEMHCGTGVPHADPFLAQGNSLCLCPSCQSWRRKAR